ncbi:hypothetical protein SLE2022_392060 [Rubroshorea leprosula]
MEMHCDLEVNVNGQEVFMIDKKILASFSGKFSKLFSSMTGPSKNLKVIFHDFPGGAEGFELISRFCYNNGKAGITPSNLVLLNCAARFMEMKNNGSRSSLIDQTVKSLEGISLWTWSELLVALRECQDLLPASSSLILEKVLDCVIGRLALPIAASPCTFSSDNSSFQGSCDTRSSYSMRNNHSQASWWFEDFLFLNIDLIEKATMMMLSHNLDHATISKFLLYYQKSRFLSATPAEKCRITEVTICLLSLLDRSSLSCKVLFLIFHPASSLRISKCHKRKLENLIGSLLDQATIDHLLIPSPRRKGYMYDVNLVLRLVKAFRLEGSCWLSPTRLRKVSRLVDSFLVEVAADAHLKPSKFAALAMLLPDSARESHDRLCHAMDMYLEVHGGLCEEEKIGICSALNYEKLSRDALKHLALNSNFPSRISVQAFINQQSKPKNLFNDKNFLKTSTSSLSAQESMDRRDDVEQILLYAKRVNFSRKNEMLEAKLQGNQWRATELKNFCGTTQTHMGNITRLRLSLSGLGNNTRFLPKICP